MRVQTSHLARLALDAVVPPACLLCRETVETPGQLCASCWSSITFIAEPQCVQCGVPFSFETGPETLCAACIADPPEYDAARAAMVYDEAARRLVIAFKHLDRLEGAPSFAEWMIRAGRALLEDDPLLVPVPLHRWRLLTRRYNQAALLAKAIAEKSGCAWDPLLLRRTKATPSQRGLSAKGRLRNVSGAFALRPDKSAQIEGRPVVLIDDVLTTGATVNACARLLRHAGASRIGVLTLARVAGPTGVL